MLKRLWAAALLACVPAAHALNGKLFFTLAPNVHDQFANIMPFRSPHIPYVGKCVRNQPVELLLVLANPATGKDGKVLVEIDTGHAERHRGQRRDRGFRGERRPFRRDRG